MYNIEQTKHGEIVYDTLYGIYGAKGKYGFKWFQWKNEAEDYLKGFYFRWE